MGIFTIQNPMGWEDQIIQTFIHMAYDPLFVYAMVVFLMFASSFGLPLPEEVTIIGASLTAYIASHPGKYPPPPGETYGVSPYGLATVCLLSVFVSDYFIYWIGAYFGDRLARHPRWGKTFKSKSFQKVKKWIHDYGTMAPCIFRFTPGLRFPGHLMCGAIGLPPWKFAMVVGLAALFTVPTQVLLISAYGEMILSLISKVKLTFIALGVLIFIASFLFLKKRKQKQ